MTCQCDMRTKLVGDGCETCNPAKALEYAKERIDELEAELDEIANPIGDHALISVPRKDFRRIEAEREELQGKMNRARVTFENPLLAKLEDLTKERDALREDAERILETEREEIIAAIPGGSSVDPQWVCDMIRARGKK